MKRDYSSDPRHIELAFGEGEFDSSNGRIRFRIADLAELAIVSGAVAAGPVMFGDLARFAGRIEPGRYPVSLAIIHG
jgi:hypothetical protein